MKCGIITYHFANNYGAMLQCLALKKTIENQGHNAVVINYVSDKQFDNNSVHRKEQGIKGFAKNIILLPFYAGRKKREMSFEKFRREHLGCDFKRIRKMAELKRYIVQNEFEVVISGSDQVWNPNVFDFEDAFFLPFKIEAKKIGYAVSLGTATSSQLQPYKEWINDFDQITVRESKSADVLSKITKAAIKTVVDPVLLLPQDVWKTFTSIKKSNYLLCYFVRKEDLGLKIQKAKELAQKLNLELRIINLRITKYNLTKPIVFDLSPIEFLEELANAGYVYTDSFHGTAFSLIYEKNFTTVVSDLEIKDNRKSNMLNMVGLQSRIKRTEDSAEILDTIDYSIIVKKLNSIREESNEILSNFWTSKV